ncbi:MAG: hypothetical protein KAJ19_11725 [Gammaproteobacteria bacterium]|nr:hypothetical protein [Gammaproteobacteria bacterium]
MTNPTSTIREFPEPVIYQYVEGVGLPKLFGRLDILPPDITGYTIEMHIEHPDDSVFTVSGAVTNGPTGEFELPGADRWPEGALVNGLLWSPIHFTDTLGRLTVVPNIWLNVVRRLTP